MKKLLFLLTFLAVILLPKLASATDLSDWHILEMDKVYLDYAHYTFASEPFLAQAGFTPTNKLDVHIDFNMANNILFMQNMVHSETDDKQFRLVGWNYKFGVHVGDSVDVFFEHYSQHILDAAPVISNMYDSVGVRVYLYKNSKGN